MKSALKAFLICFGIWVLSSCASKKPYYRDDNASSPVLTDPLSIRYSLFLSGGLPLSQSSPTLNAILQAQPTGKSGLVLLGDVVGTDDFTNVSGENSMAASSPVNLVPELDRRFEDLFLLPGQREWSSGKKVSITAFRALDRMVKDVKQKGRLIKPEKGCGTPEVVRLTDHTILVLVDSQWAIEVETNPGEKLPGCELANILEWRSALKDIIQSHPTDHIIIATHHPVFANGPTAGNYPASSHLVPLPVLGTLITALKSLMASNQHFGHPAYEAYRKALTSAVDGCQNCVIVSGHEKSLQYYYEEDQHYLVAGSGNEYRHARKREHAGFSFMSLGYVRIDQLANDHLLLSFVAVDKMNAARVVWEKDLGPPAREVQNKNELTGVGPASMKDSVLMPASDQYGKKKFLRGNFYRQAWSLPVKMPVMWLDSVYGGLKPLQLGGGNQTRSLRMENADGEQYVIRSIDKKVTNVLPPALRGTFAENIVQDGIAASHPYGALVIPKLAKAAGIFYTHPSVVYVPHQPSLGIYDQEVGDGVYILEERPGGNTSSFSCFGNTKKTISSADLVELLVESPKHVVDQKSVLRARLFDLWTGDWDRHDDQWRWAAFDENGRTIYRPIPRDRDQVFFKNDGVLDQLASRPYFNPPLRRFLDTVDYVPGLVWAGKYFDRTFLHEMTEEDFKAEAAFLQQQLTDAVIDEAFLDWPKEIDNLDGEEIRSFLRSRRDDLVSYASLFYKHISKEVFIPGSDDQDRIRVMAIDQDRLSVTVERKNNGDEFSGTYQRTFTDGVTKEIRLFGLSKKDTFILEGEGHPKILLRLVGGTGEDLLLNQSQHLKVKAYDGADGMVIFGEPVTGKLNNKPFNNSFDRTDWSLNRHIHFPSPTYFTDEGFGLTYNYWSTRFGFRSDPYKSKHAAAFSYFFDKVGFIGRYSGEWLHAFGDCDFGVDAFVTGPTYTQYFYGLGNEYVDYGEKDSYHIVKGGQIILAPSISRRFGFGSSVMLSPAYHYLDLEGGEDDTLFVDTPAAGLAPEDFGSKHYASLSASYRFERLDNTSFPSRGADLEVSFGGRTSLGNTTISHGLLSAGGSIYIPFDVTGTLVLATHIGADMLFGEYEFFHAYTLGGMDRLRGFRRDRFAGHARFYQATDLRFKLFKNQGIVPFSFGIYGSMDYGRVWFEEEDASAGGWHTSFGGGVFIVPLGFTAFRVGYMAGENDYQFNIGGSLRF